jgi:hypothetical protein
MLKAKDRSLTNGAFSTLSQQVTLSPSKVQTKSSAVLFCGLPRLVWSE